MVEAATQGFGAYILRALRVDEEHDWSSNYIDYAAFKRLLSSFSQRRAWLRNALREMPDHRMTEEEFRTALLHFVEETTPLSGSIIAPKFLSGDNVMPQISETDNSNLSYTNRCSSPEVLQTSDFVYGEVPSITGNSKHSIKGLPVPPRVAADEDSSCGSSAPYRSLTDANRLSGSRKSGGTESGSSSRFLARKPKRMKERKIMRLISGMERSELGEFLDEEIYRAASFYRARLARLSQASAEISERPTQTVGWTFVSVGDEILELLDFVTINVAATRQILIRYDAFVLTFGGTPISSWYMKERRTLNQSWFKELLGHQDLLALAHSHIRLGNTVGIDEGDNGHFKYSRQIYSNSSSRSENYANDFTYQMDMFKHILSKTQRTFEQASNGYMVSRDSIVATLRDYFLLGSISESLRLQPQYLEFRGQSLSAEMKLLVDWRETKVPPEPDLLSGMPDHMFRSLDSKQRLAIVLNLASTCLYMMNYFIVEPSSTKYVNALGCRDSMSGMLIGALPCAVLISSLLYSMWSNYSFRRPLLASGVLLICGNILYASAYSFKSIRLALAGRFLTGLGGPKSINRRVIADITPMAIRTAINAFFGTAVAVGTALGPATAVRLDSVDFQFEIPLFGTFYVNGMTSPGCLMAILWTIFTIIIAFKFEEPSRLGLQEQKEKEAETNLRRSSTCDQSTSEIPISKPTRDSSSNQLSPSLINAAPNWFSFDDNDIQELQPIKEEDDSTFFGSVRFFCKNTTQAVWVCMLLLFCKMFAIESVVSSTSALTKNRYGWQVKQVGTLGCINGMLMIPISVGIGALSNKYQDRDLMTALICIAICGMLLLIDVSDLVSTETNGYNYDDSFSVGTERYVSGYFMVFCACQAFDSVIGSALSKVIPTVLASGTLNSGLIATWVGTLGRTCGDVFISTMGFINIRQFMNLLFLPNLFVLLFCFTVLRRNYDILAV
uniref:SPX domain-containing protein n=1 Tax=Attheya septentrionalis TaxID=420275 RepID=A0A7S2XPH5_9STRA|mmetsp:Transcript_26906/g.48922  ORF Transcript_26906/g.48922 Transcript_26906/m.48922 type:complete len:955 (+) Transcript_26906:395-3259(+)